MILPISRNCVFLFQPGQTKFKLRLSIGGKLHFISLVWKIESASGFTGALFLFIYINEVEKNQNELWFFMKYWITNSLWMIFLALVFILLSISCNFGTFVPQAGVSTNFTIWAILFQKTWVQNYKIYLNSYRFWIQKLFL